MGEELTYPMILVFPESESENILEAIPEFDEKNLTAIIAGPNSKDFRSATGMVSQRTHDLFVNCDKNDTLQKAGILFCFLEDDRVTPARVSKGFPLGKYLDVVGIINQMEIADEGIILPLEPEKLEPELETEPEQEPEKLETEPEQEPELEKELEPESEPAPVDEKFPVETEGEASSETSTEETE